jgi:hypothetical protein
MLSGMFRQTLSAGAAIIPVLEIGLQKFEKESNIAVDAAKVNPQLQLPQVASHEGRLH